MPAIVSPSLTQKIPMRYGFSSLPIMVASVGATLIGMLNAAVLREGRLTAFLQQHVSDIVSSTVFSPDGKHIVTDHGTGQRGYGTQRPASRSARRLAMTLQSRR